MPWGRTTGRCSLHPRGCSLARGQELEERVLLPAPVGMFPTWQSRSPTPSCCSAHPRGCSLLQIQTPEPLRLLPAPVGLFLPAPSAGTRSAGMFALRLRRRSAATSTLRIHGDVPEFAGEFAIDGVCSPHPGGCSRDQGHRHVGHRLLLARAGMVPISRRRPTRRPPVPRTHGDVPGTYTVITGAGACPPHPRDPVLLPAPAGTVPAGSGDLRRAGPAPAPAGWFRRRQREDRSQQLLPAPAGDVPRVYECDNTLANCFPSPWGCSSDHHTVRRCGALLPAPVGMFPPRSARGWPR